MFPLPTFSLTASNKTNYELNFDDEKNLVLVKSEFPYEKKILLCPNQIYGNQATFFETDICVSVGKYNENDDFSYAILLSEFDDTIALRVIKYNPSDFDKTSLEVVAEIKSKSDENQDDKTFTEKDILVFASFVDEQLQMLFLNHENHTYKIIVLEKNNAFSFYSIDNFTLPMGSSLSCLPADIFSEQNFCFILFNGITRSHDFIQLVKNENRYYFETLTSLQENMLLHPQWKFQFSALLYSANETNNGDEYLTTLKHTEKNHSAIIFLRPDGKLAVIEFIPDEGNGYSFDILAISENSYSKTEYYFYATLFDRKQNKEILLGKNNRTQKIVVLSLEKNISGAEFKFQFKETPVHLNLEHQEAQRDLLNYFSDDGFHNQKNFLVRSHQNTDESLEIPFQILVKAKQDNTVKSLHDLSFQKNKDGQYVTLHHKSLNHDGTLKNPKPLLGIYHYNGKTKYVSITTFMLGLAGFIFYCLAIYYTVRNIKAGERLLKRIKNYCCGFAQRTNTATQRLESSATTEASSLQEDKSLSAEDFKTKFATELNSLRPEASGEYELNLDKLLECSFVVWDDTPQPISASPKEFKKIKQRTLEHLKNPYIYRYYNGPQKYDGSTFYNALISPYPEKHEVVLRSSIFAYYDPSYFTLNENEEANFNQFYLSSLLNAEFPDAHARAFSMQLVLSFTRIAMRKNRPIFDTYSASPHFTNQHQETLSAKNALEIGLKHLDKLIQKGEIHKNFTLRQQDRNKLCLLIS